MTARTAAASSSTTMSTSPLALRNAIAPRSCAVCVPKPLASTTAGPFMPMLERSVPMMTSQQAKSAALPAKQSPKLTPMSGTRPDSLAKSVKTLASTPTVPTLPRGRPSPSENSTRGTRQSCAISWTLFLPIVTVGIGSGRVVAVHHGDPRAFIANEVGVDAAESHDRPAGGRSGCWRAEFAE